MMEREFEILSPDFDKLHDKELPAPPKPKAEETFEDYLYKVLEDRNAKKVLP